MFSPGVRAGKATPGVIDHLFPAWTPGLNAGIHPTSRKTAVESGPAHLVDFPGKRYNGGFQNQGGADMVDGVIDIPLLGNPLHSTAEQNGAVALGNFLAGPENRLVEVALRSIVEEKANGYNPLVLYGPSGTGKSHLAEGIAASWRVQHRRSRVVHTSAVDFARELADAIETQAVDEFRAKHRGANLLIVEDLGRLVARRSEKLNTQEELVHTLDALLAEGRWAVVTAPAPPSEIAGLLPALQSRLSGGLCVPLSPPGPEARLALLQRSARSRNLDLPAPVAAALAEGLSGTAPELAGALWELAAPGRLDLAAAREYVGRRSRGRQPSLHEIALATARHFSIRLSEMRGPSRRRALVAARGVAEYLARKLGNERLEEIGRYFGGRDHATVLHGIHKTEESIRSDALIREAIELLTIKLWKK